MAENLSFEIMPELLRDNEKIAFYNKGKNYNSGVIICDIQKYLEAGIEGILIEELKKGKYLILEDTNLRRIVEATKYPKFPV